MQTKGNRTQIKPGYRAGQLTVVTYPRRLGNSKRYVVTVECDCGVRKEVRTNALTVSGTTRSLGYPEEIL